MSLTDTPEAIISGTLNDHDRVVLSDLIDVLHGDLATIRDNDHEPIPSVDAAVISSAWHWARQNYVPATNGNLESVRFYAAHVRELRVRYID